MRIQLTARHTDVSDAVRRRAEERIARLARFDRRVTAAELVFDEEKHLKRVEALLQVEGDGSLVARAEAPTFREALDRLTDKLGRTLRRHRDRRRDRRRAAAGEEAGGE